MQKSILFMNALPREGTETVARFLINIMITCKEFMNALPREGTETKRLQNNPGTYDQVYECTSPRGDGNFSSSSRFILFLSCFSFMNALPREGTETSFTTAGGLFPNSFGVYECTSPRGDGNSPSGN